MRRGLASTRFFGDHAQTYQAILAQMSDSLFGPYSAQLVYLQVGEVATAKVGLDIGQTRQIGLVFGALFVGIRRGLVKYDAILFGHVLKVELDLLLDLKALRSLFSSQLYQPFLVVALDLAHFECA